jgi:Ni/Co efflux regulator RcnB
MMKRVILGILAAVALLASAAQAQESKQDQTPEFLKAGDVIHGLVRVVNAKHPNGTPILAYQIVSDAPKAFAQKDGFCKATPPKTFHLVETDNKVKAGRLKRSVGKKIDLVVDEFMCSQTAWHIGDAVATKWRFTGPEPR